MTTAKYPIPAKALEQNILVLGKTRSGKSSAMRSIVEPMLDDTPVQPPCIIDPKGDWWGLKSGYEIVIFGGTHADVPLTEHMGQSIAEIVATSTTPTLLDLSDFTVGQRTRFFVDFAATFFRIHRGQRKLILDEVHNFAPQGKVHDPQSGMMLHWANRLASEGSGRGITLIAASQRPQKVHKDFVTSMETLIAKKVIHKLDRDAVKDWIDGCGDPERGKEVLTSLAKLQRPEGWVWSPEIEFGPEIVVFPMFRTYDSFKPQPAEIDVSGWREIDVDEIRERLATFVQQQEADDPKMLRKRIADLESQIQSGQSAPSARALLDAEQDGYSKGCKAGRQIFIDQYFAALDALSASLIIHSTTIDDILEEWKNANPARPPASPMAKTMAEELATGPKTEVKNPSARKILDVIHRTYPVWISFDAAARRAGISKASSAYHRYRKAVIESGEVEGQDGKLRSLPAFAKAGAIDGNDGIDAWISRLPPSHGKMLQAISRHGGGRGIGRERIAEHAGISPTSSGLGKGLGELRRLELITECNGLYTLAEGLR